MSLQSSESLFQKGTAHFTQDQISKANLVKEFLSQALSDSSGIGAPGSTTLPQGLQKQGLENAVHLLQLSQNGKLDHRAMVEYMAGSLTSAASAKEVSRIVCDDLAGKVSGKASEKSGSSVSAKSEQSNGKGGTQRNTAAKIERATTLIASVQAAVDAAGLFAQACADIHAAAQFTPPKPKGSGFIVEGQEVACALDPTSPDHASTPLTPGTGCPTVLYNGRPVWRVGLDVSKCAAPVVPPHPPGFVQKGASKTAVGGQAVVRKTDIVEEGTPPQPPLPQMPLLSTQLPSLTDLSIAALTPDGSTSSGFQGYFDAFLKSFAKDAVFGLASAAAVAGFVAIAAGSVAVGWAVIPAAAAGIAAGALASGALGAAEHGASKGDLPKPVADALGGIKKIWDANKAVKSLKAAAKMISEIEDLAKAAMNLKKAGTPRPSLSSQAMFPELAAAQRQLEAQAEAFGESVAKSTKQHFDLLKKEIVDGAKRGVKEGLESIEKSHSVKGIPNSIIPGKVGSASGAEGNSDASNPSGKSESKSADTSESTGEEQSGNGQGADKTGESGRSKLEKNLPEGYEIKEQTPRGVSIFTYDSDIGLFTAQKDGVRYFQDPSSGKTFTIEKKP